jgi:hypothetical protein
MLRGQPKFNVALVEAVHEGLNSISPSISDTVLFHLQRVNAICIDQNFVDAEMFDDGLKKLFGFGAVVIERKILEFLYVKLDAPRKIADSFEFSEEVAKAQKLQISMQKQ